MRRRMISIALVIVFSLSLIGMNPIGNHVVKAEEYRNGYALTPLVQDTTGIDTKTAFLFKSKEQVTSELLQKELKVSPEITFTVEKGQGGLLITPTKELEKHALYTFTFRDASWTYQTMSQLKVLGTLPANETSNIPLNSGIEMYFNYEDVQIKDYFKIQPEVQGTFEIHGKTVVFVPKALKEKTIYAVTLKAGIGLPNSNQKLLEDYTFTFETASKEAENYVEPKGYFVFSNPINEFALNEVPKIPLSYYVNDKASQQTIKTTVYAYTSIEQFSEDILKNEGAPYWSVYGLENYKLKTDQLNKTLTFEQPIVENQTGQQYLNLPEKLKAGYYLIDSTWDNIHFQTFIQVTDLSYYFMDSATKNLLWLNDLSTGKSISGAEVTEKSTGKKFISNQKGIVELPVNDDEKNVTLYLIKNNQQSALVVDQSHYRYYWNNTNSNYWKYLQTDRNIYLPDDTVNLWGFLKNRYNEEQLEELTLEVNTMSWRFLDIWGGYGNVVPFVTQKIPVKNGFYEGSIDLPNLEPGNYQVEIKNKDDLISSTYIQVEKYVKPEYKIDVTPSKKAVFVGEPVTFTFNTNFFEGTPVANIKLHYNISGSNILEGSLVSNTKGESKIEYTPEYIDGYQGLNYVNVNGFATLPESGEIYTNNNLKVFFNDIEVKLDSTLNKNVGTITAQVNDIVLDKLNDNNDKNDNDYLGKSIPNHRINGIIYKNTWKKRATGDYYDPINKIVVTQYEYYTEKTKFQDIQLITNASGKAEAIINLPKEQDSYYTAELITADRDGKKMTFNQYFGEAWYSNPNESNRYLLKSEKDTYSLDEQIKVQFVNNDKPLAQGNFLYITAQNGIRKYETSNYAVYNTTFDKTFVPNADIIGVYFNGKTYIQGESFSPRLDFEKNRIKITATTDKTAYKPGEICTVKINATIYSKEEKKDIGAKGVQVNLSIVDEALFKLSEQSVTTLESLYEWVPNGVYATYISHKNDGLGVGRPVAYGKGLGGLNNTEEAAKSADMSTNAGKETIRSEFKDTAYFMTVQLDDKGTGSLSFQLPDNVTSWRLTLAGISKDLMAGSDKEEIIVTLPYFINTSLNTTFLVGDKPSIGISTYGNGLKENEKVFYEITCKENGFKTKASGLAFQRVNVGLFEMKEGNYTLIVKSTSETGYTDAIEKTIKVFKSYHEKEVADYYKLKEGLTIKTNENGMTKLTFVDHGKGQFMPELYNLAYQSGKRVDQKYIALLSRALLEKVYHETTEVQEEVTLTDYQMEDGGFGILPYAGSDIETTVKLLPLIKDSINKKTVISYLNHALNQKDAIQKPCILYGLAIMGEPVMLELNKLAEVNNLSLKDALYLSLAFTQIGDTYKAKSLYDTFILPSIEKYEDKARAKVGKTEDEYLEYTALVMLLASNLNLKDKELFYHYVKDAQSKEILVNSEKLTYIQNEIAKVVAQTLVVNYQYDGKDYSKKLENGWTETISIPSAKLKDFKVKAIEGEGGLVAIYKAPLLSKTKNDINLKAERAFFNSNTGVKSNSFKQSDIVKVEIKWDIAKTAVDDAYILTDYAPSGLKPIENVWDMGLKIGNNYWYKDIDGQKVTFSIYGEDPDKKPLYYYARVVAPGTYKAEGVIIQGVTVKDSLWVGNQDIITIQE